MVMFTLIILVDIIGVENEKIERAYEVVDNIWDKTIYSWISKIF